MTQYIDKAAVVAEIERLYKEHSSRECIDEAGVVLDKLEDFIDTLEVKEIDLEKEIDVVWNSMSVVGKKDFTDIAKHFFELGLKVQKGE